MKDTSRGMSEDMYNFIVENMGKVDIDLENGLITTQKGTNGTVCSSTGYLRVRLNKRLCQVHQLLAVAYFGRACIGYQINHIDGNKMNNKKENLEAITRSENIRHQINNDLSMITKRMVRVDKLDLEGGYICTYNSVAEAGKDVGLSSGAHISSVLNGSRKTAKGFRWRVSEEV